MNNSFFFLNRSKENLLENCFNPFWAGDGWCDDGLNTPECNYDNGDCCGDDVLTSSYYCVECECKNPTYQGNLLKGIGNKTLRR